MRKTPTIVNGIQLGRGIYKCLECGHEGSVGLFQKNMVCEQCGVDGFRLTYFDVLADGSKGEEYPPPKPMATA